MADSIFEFGTSPFYFLRHGETDESREGIVKGQSESELNDAGSKMAEAAAETLLGVSLGSIYSSPLKRTWKTASIVSALTGAPTYPLPGLMERHWGAFQGRPKAHRPTTPNPDTVETEDDFRRRVGQAMASIAGPLPVLVVSHSGVFRAIYESVGTAIDRRVKVASGQVLRMEPPTGDRRSWSIRVV